MEEHDCGDSHGDTEFKDLNACVFWQADGLKAGIYQIYHQWTP